MADSWNYGEYGRTCFTWVSSRNLLWHVRQKTDTDLYFSETMAQRAWSQMASLRQVLYAHCYPLTLLLKIRNAEDTFPNFQLNDLIFAFFPYLFVSLVHYRAPGIKLLIVLMKWAWKKLSLEEYMPMVLRSPLLSSRELLSLASKVGWVYFLLLFCSFP